MKYYLKEILPRLKKYSATLDQSAFLVDKPWVVANTDEKFEKLIFKKDGTLYLSSNGDVTVGKWEYLPEAQALLIDCGDKKKLYRHQYLDESVLALKLDGPDRSDNNYYLLANENEVKDCNAKKYLHEKYAHITSISSDTSTHTLSNAIGANHIIKSDEFKIIEKAANLQYVERNGKIVKQGRYLIDGGRTLIIVKNGTIQSKLKKFNYNDGIEVWQKISVPTEGDIVNNNQKTKMSIYNDDDTKFDIEINNDGTITSVKENLSIQAILILAFLIIFIILFFSMVTY